MKPGVHYGMSFADYRADDFSRNDTWETAPNKSVSKSMITGFIKDPSVWKQPKEAKTTAAMRSGSLLDCLLTTPDQYSHKYVISPYAEFRTNESKAWRTEMEESGVEVIKEDQYTFADMQLNAIKAKPEAAGLIKDAQFQVAFCHKTAYPFTAKGLIDILPNDKETLVDLKTCEPSALDSKRNLQRHIYDWAYHVQAGAYCEGMSIASGNEYTRFKFIFVSNKPPVRVAVVELPFSAISFGADIYRNGIKYFAECLERNYFPSIWDGEFELDLPQYAYNQNEPE